MERYTILQFSAGVSSPIENVVQIGVQAPSGYTFQINGKEIQTGKMGLYECEFDDDNAVSVYFTTPADNSEPFYVDIVQLKK